MIDPNIISFILFFLLSLSLIPLAICAIVLFIISAYKDYRKKRFYLLRYYFIGLLIVIVVFVALFAITLLINKAPTEEELIRNYNTNKTEFNNLVKRIQIDQKIGLERVDDDWTRPENVTSIGLTEQDIVNYRNDFRNLNIPRGFYAFSDRIDFIAHTSGLSISGSSEGYLYSTIEPKNYFKKNCGYSLKPFNDLREYKGCKGYTHSYTIYQPIDKNWFIYKDYED